MASDGSLKSPTHYVQRLLEDEYAQEQLRAAAIGLRAAYRRAGRKRAQAAKDKKLYDNLQQAATSVRQALLALQRPKPKPRHRARKLATAVVVVGGAAALLIATRGRKRGQPAAMYDVGADAPGTDGASAGTPTRETAGGA